MRGFERLRAAVHRPRPRFGGAAGRFSHAGWGGSPPQAPQEAALLTEMRDMMGRAFKEAVTQPYLLSLMVGSILLSVASFFTTFAGMLNFMPVWFITFCIVFAIQALLFVTAWKIGYAISDREPAPWFSIFVFLVCFATSVFFSWVALFETINDEELQARTRETRIHRAAEDTVSELHARALAERRERVEALLDSDVYTSWRDGVTAVADRAAAAREVIDAQFQQRARDAAARIATLEEERAALQQTKASATERVEAAKRELARLEEERPALAARVEQLRAERDTAREQVVLAEGRMKAEETGGSADRPAGRGPVWRQLRDQRNILAADAETKDRLFSQASADLQTINDTLDRHRAAVNSGEAASVAAPLAAIDQELNRLSEAKLADGADAGDRGLDSEVEALRANLAAFATKLELEPFNAAAAQCATLLEMMRANSELAPRAADLSCDRARMAEFMNPINVSVENLRTLERECVVGGENAQAVGKLNFAQAVDYGRNCISFSGLPANAVADLRGEIDRLVLEEDPNASRFVKTVNAFLGGEKLSYFALAIAAFIDLLVLFSGLIGAVTTRPRVSKYLRGQWDRNTEENVMRALSVDLAQREEDPQNIRTAKALLRYVDTPPADAPLPPKFIAEARLSLRDVPAESGLRDEVKSTAMTLKTVHMAVADPADPSVFYLKAGFLERLRKEVLEHQHRAPHTPAPALPRPPVALAAAVEAAPAAANNGSGEVAVYQRVDAPSNPEAVRMAEEAGRTASHPAQVLGANFDSAKAHQRVRATAKPLSEEDSEENINVDDTFDIFLKGINATAAKQANGMRRAS